MAIAVVNNVTKVRGFFVTAVAGAEVLLLLRDTDDPATHYTDEDGSGASTDPMTADSSGQIITYMDAGAYDYKYRAPGTEAYTGPIPFDVGGNLDEAALREITFTFEGSSFTPTEWGAEFGFAVAGRSLLFVTGQCVDPENFSISSSDFHPESERIVFVPGQEGAVQSVYMLQIETDGSVTWPDTTPTEFSANFVFLKEDLV